MLNTQNNPLAGKTLAIIGYGSQGRAHALNLRDSGYKVLVGLRATGATAKQARDDGFTVLEPKEAAERADLVAMLVPDMAQKKLFEEALKPALAAGKTLLFAHGFAIHFGHIVPSQATNVVLVAPKGPGNLVRREYQQGGGVPCLIAAYRDATGDALAQARAYAEGLGAGRSAIIETSFGEETETDLFGEQAVLCGGATELVKAGFETLVEAGYQPEVAYFECMHELKLIVDLLYEGGLSRMYRFVSDTACYGSLTRGKQVVDAATRARMKTILEDIRSGRFSDEWTKFYAEKDGANFRAAKERECAHPIETVGAKLRERMAWLTNSRKAA